MSLFRKFMIMLAILTWLCGFAYCFASVHLGSARIPFTIGKVYYLSTTDQLNKDEKVFYEETYKLIFKFPELEAIKSISKGDYRLIGIAGFGLFFPGTPREYEETLVNDRKLTRIIMGIGDCSYNRTDRIYHEVSYNFALRYNSVIWPFLKATLNQEKPTKQ